ncbi:hypothetical protein B0H16DRAFT_1703450 [Mycena metata]|uniref:Uncharacterized protein n=1 Tax=Mycena metata TaxID=1033252 RepID=A0AAD7MD50_9AGAR|nr:hypothetical protein B0H16DRAFT_1703450 [Mycena metata]
MPHFRSVAHYIDTLSDFLQPSNNKVFEGTPIHRIVSPDFVQQSPSKNAASRTKGGRNPNSLRVPYSSRQCQLCGHTAHCTANKIRFDLAELGFEGSSDIAPTLYEILYASLAAGRQANVIMMIAGHGCGSTQCFCVRRAEVWEFLGLACPEFHYCSEPGVSSFEANKIKKMLSRRQLDEHRNTYFPSEARRRVGVGAERGGREIPRFGFVHLEGNLRRYRRISVANRVEDRFGIRKSFVTSTGNGQAILGSAWARVLGRGSSQPTDSFEEHEHEKGVGHGGNSYTVHTYATPEGRAGGGAVSCCHGVLSLDLYMWVLVRYVRISPSGLGYMKLEAISEDQRSTRRQVYIPTALGMQPTPEGRAGSGAVALNYGVRPAQLREKTIRIQGTRANPSLAIARSAAASQRSLLLIGGLGGGRALRYLHSESISGARVIHIWTEERVRVGQSQTESEIVVAAICALTDSS